RVSNFYAKNVLGENKNNIIVDAGAEISSAGHRLKYFSPTARIFHTEGHIQYSCNCEDFTYYNFGRRMCSHITALMYKYINEHQSGIAEQEAYIAADLLVDRLKGVNSSIASVKRELKLEINLFVSSIGHGMSHVELKVGLEKTYVVKNMKNFLMAFEEGSCMEFGKNYSYDPELQEFNNSDKEVLGLLCEISDFDDSIGSIQGYWVNTGLLKGKTVVLAEKQLVRFLEKVGERRINVIIDGNEYKAAAVLKEDLPLDFEVNMEGDKILFAPSGKAPAALNRSYEIFWYEGNIYLPPKEQARMYEPIDKALKVNSKGVIQFRKSEGEKIGAYLIPALRKVSKEVRLKTSMEELLLEEPLKVKIYLDRQDEAVTGSIELYYGDIIINPADGRAPETGGRILIREIEREEAAVSILKSFNFQEERSNYILKEEKDIITFISEGIGKLQDIGEVYYSEAFRNIKLHKKASVKAGVRVNDQNLLEFDFELTGVGREELRTLFEAVREKRKYYRLKSGDFLSLEDETLKDFVQMIDHLGIKDKEISEETIVLSKYNALYMDEKIKDKNLDFIKRSKNFRELSNNIKDIKDMEYPVPQGLEAVMRNYQLTGYKWFKALADCGFGGILADEMGLGKTLQTIAFLASVKGEVPSIVIAPTSLLYNWMLEVEKFAPDMKVVVISGNKKQREEQRTHLPEADIVITSYPLIRTDIDEYKDIKFKYCIIDEAQNIKNPNSQNAASVKSIKADGYFALTGTPIENSLTELWSIFDFIMPGYLLSHNKFKKVYESPIIERNDKGALEELLRHVRPFILRRLKKDVALELPPKIEQMLIVEMTEDQKRLYAAYLQQAREDMEQDIRDVGIGRSRIKVLAALTRLRQICCDPSVFLEDYHGDSGKLQALEELLEETVDNGHKVLLFSQFTSALKNISRRLGDMNIDHMYLDGQVKSEERMAMVKEFNEGDKSVFLISL
ncbi:MAG: SNF2 helicase associated domain-containing protein, partial [Bacillota bacterium]|nr:SNF2 helicase associated domain-containing protein [Bacillota bacterium]